VPNRTIWWGIDEDITHQQVETVVKTAWRNKLAFRPNPEHHLPIEMKDVSETLESIGSRSWLVSNFLWFPPTRKRSLNWDSRKYGIYTYRSAEILVVNWLVNGVFHCIERLLHGGESYSNSRRGPGTGKTPSNAFSAGRSTRSSKIIIPDSPLMQSIAYHRFS
jgi:hypothetical protein